MISHALGFPKHAHFSHPPQLLTNTVPPLQVLELPQLGHFHPFLSLQLLQHVTVGLKPFPFVDPLHRLLPPNVKGDLTFVLKVLTLRLALHLSAKIGSDIFYQFLAIGEMMSLMTTEMNYEKY